MSEQEVIAVGYVGDAGDEVTQKPKRRSIYSISRDEQISELRGCLAQADINNVIAEWAIHASLDESDDL